MYTDFKLNFVIDAERWTIIKNQLLESYKEASMHDKYFTFDGENWNRLNCSISNGLTSNYPYPSRSVIQYADYKMKNDKYTTNDASKNWHVGPGVKTAENEQGGKQSELPYRFDLIDSGALFQLAETLHHGAERYGVDNWRKIETDSHLNHALSHIYAYLGGDTQDEHLAHAFCRLMMAVAQDKPKKPAERKAGLGRGPVWFDEM